MNLQEIIGLKFPMVIAYNKKEKKMGCPLVQAMFGGYLHATMGLDTPRWELDPSKCLLYRVENREEFDKIIEMSK